MDCWEFIEAERQDMTNVLTKMRDRLASLTQGLELTAANLSGSATGGSPVSTELALHSSRD
jgi:hypothetical protein